jgi:surface protein
VSYGKGIKFCNKDNNYDIEHRCNTLSGSSGGPILNLTTNKVIGIHKGAINKNSIAKFNIGTLLKFPLNEIKNNINKNNIKNEINMEVNINVEDTNNKIYFLNNVSEINDSNTELYINNIKHEFKKYFEPTNQGIYSIKLKFNFNFKSCSGLFLGCKNLKSIDLSSFNTKDVINMSRMFENCIQLESVNFSSFNTRNVSNMIRMFYNCRNLKRIDLSSFDTKNVKYMNQMFYKCINLKTIDLTHFDLKNVCEMKSMFYFENVFNGGINVNKEAYEKIKELNSFITKFSCF